jgi:hypothetical protein
MSSYILNYITLRIKRLLFRGKCPVYKSIKGCKIKVSKLLEHLEMRAELLVRMLPTFRLTVLGTVSGDLASGTFLWISNHLLASKAFDFVALE